MKLSDFPAGWRAEPDTKNDDSPKCYDGTSISSSAGNAKADSDKFSKGQSEVTASVAVSGAEATIDAAMAKLEQKDTIDCLRRWVTDTVEKNSKGKATVDFGQLSADPIGDKVVAYQVKVTVEVSGLTPSAYIDLYFVKVGRGVVAMSFTDTLMAFDAAERTTLLNTAVDRLEAELAKG